MRHFAKSLFAIAALSIAVSTLAHATTITFGPPPPPGTDVDFVTYTQAGSNFVAANGCLTACSSQFIWNLNQITAPPDTPPSLFGGVGTEGGNLHGDAQDSVTVTNPGGAAFFLASFDLDPETAAATYLVTGYDSGGTVVYSFGGTDSTTGKYTTIDAMGLALTDDVSAVTITLKNSSGVYALDDIVVNATPEPSSLLLLGTSLLGLGVLARRRFAL